MILIIDNYDSFTYNLYQMVGAINPNIKVVRNDEIKPEEINIIKPDKIAFALGTKQLEKPLAEKRFMQKN